MKPEPPRFALVVWPNDNMVRCIYLHSVADAVKRNAIVIAAEDEELCIPHDAFSPKPEKEA